MIRSRPLTGGIFYIEELISYDDHLAPNINPGLIKGGAVAGKAGFIHPVFYFDVFGYGVPGYLYLLCVMLAKLPIIEFACWSGPGWRKISILRLCIYGLAPR